MTQPIRPGGPPSTLGDPPAFAGPDLDARVIDLASAAWCWSHLRSSTEGVLSSAGGRKPADLAVTYVVDDGQILIPSGSFVDAARLLVGTEVSLGLSGRAEGLRWVVRATGLALLSVLPGDSLTACRDRHPAQGTAFLSSDALLLRIDRLRGYFETSLDPGEPR
jgi:hypothetical protein